MMRSCVKKGIVLVGALVACSAMAEPKVATVVVSLDDQFNRPALLEWRQLNASIASRAGITYVDAFPRAVPELVVRAKHATGARAAYASALRAFDSADFVGALEQVENALSSFEASNLSEGFQEYVDCLALRALLLQVKRAPGVNAELKRLFVMAPDYDFPSPRLNPTFTRFATEQRSKVSALAKTSLEIDTGGVNALAYVDGRLRGVSPLTVPDLVPGQHVVTLISPEAGVVQVMAVAGPGRVLKPQFAASEASAALREQIAKLRAGVLNNNIAGPALGFARLMNAEELLLIALAPGSKGTRATLVRVTADGHVFSRVQDFSLDASRERIKEVVSLLDEKVPLLPTPGPEPVPPAVEMGWRPRTVGLVALGTGAAAVAGGVLLGVSARNQALETRKIPQVDAATYEKAASSARGTALAADGFYALAAVGAVAGAWLALTDRWPWDAPRPEGKVDPVRVSVVPVPQGGICVLGGRF